MNKELSNWRKLLAEEWLWFRQHGASLEAYVKRYGRATDPGKFGEGGELIFQADVQALQSRIERVSQLAQRRGSPSRRYLPRFYLTDEGRRVRRA